MRRVLTLLLLLSSAVPAGQPGDAVDVRGRGFDPDPADNVLLFGDEPALILAASPNHLRAVAPAGLSTGSQTLVPVVVKAHSGTSSGSVQFTLVRPSTSIFVPRFFAAPVSSATDQALVSTLLGPVLLLSDRESMARMRRDARAYVEREHSPMRLRERLAQAFEVLDG